MKIPILVITTAVAATCILLFTYLPKADTSQIPKTPRSNISQPLENKTSDQLLKKNNTDYIDLVNEYKAKVKLLESEWLESNSSDSYPLPVILEAFNKIDQESALRLIDDIDAVQLKGILKSGLSNALAKRLSKGEIEELLGSVDIDPSLGGFIALSSVRTLLETDPSKAAEWAATLPDKYAEEALVHICYSWANINQDRGKAALDFILATDDSLNLDDALSRIASLNWDTPELFSTIADAIDKDRAKALVYERMAMKQYSAKNYKESVKWYLAAEDFGNGHYSLDSALNAWSENDPIGFSRYAATSDLKERISEPEGKPKK